MLVAQLGESANELVQKWGRGTYRYGFPDQYAAEFPVRPMRWDQSRIYSGVIGKHYPNAETERYHYMFDPNMYLQPGFGTASGMSAQEAIRTFEGFLSLAPANAYGDFDVVFDTGTASGAGMDVDNRLWVIHGGTLGSLQLAVAAAGGIFATQTPDADLARRLARARQLDPTIVNATVGKVSDVRYAVENMIAALKAGTAKPVAPSPILVPTAATSTGKLSKPAKIAIAGGTALLAVGAVTAFLLTRRSHAYPRGY